MKDVVDYVATIPQGDSFPTKEGRGIEEEVKALYALRLQALYAKAGNSLDFEGLQPETPKHNAPTCFLESCQNLFGKDWIRKTTNPFPNTTDKLLNIAFSYVAKKKTRRALTHVVARNDTLFATDGHILCCLPTTTISNPRLIPTKHTPTGVTSLDDYPDYSRLLPNSFAHRYEADITDLLSALKMVDTVAKLHTSKNHLARMTLSQNKITLTAKDMYTVSLIEKTIDAVGDSDNFTLGLSTKYFLKILKDCIKLSGKTRVALESNSVLGPIKITPIGSDSYFILMPLRLKEED